MFPPNIKSFLDIEKSNGPIPFCEFVTVQTVIVRFISFFSNTIYVIQAYAWQWLPLFFKRGKTVTPKALIWNGRCKMCQRQIHSRRNTSIDFHLMSHFFYICDNQTSFFFLSFLKRVKLTRVRFLSYYVRSCVNSVFRLDTLYNFQCLHFNKHIINLLINLKAFFSLFARKLHILMSIVDCLEYFKYYLWYSVWFVTWYSMRMISLSA